MKNLHNEKIKYYYNENQSFYDVFWMNKNNLAMHYGYWEKDTKNRNQALLNENSYVEEALDLEEGDFVLDAGCGVGGTSIDIAEKYGCKVIGIGLVEKQNEAAVMNANRRSVDNLVSFKVEDFNNTSFKDESFTKIFAIESLCHSENKDEFIREAYRLLKPGGRLVVCDYFVRDISYKKNRKYYDIFCQGWAMANLADNNIYEKLLYENGFDKVTFKDHTKLALKSSRFMHRLAIAWLPIDLSLNLFKIVSDENLVSTKASLVQYYLFKNGSLMHGIFTAEKPKTTQKAKKRI